MDETMGKGGESLVHEALLYADLPAFVQGALPFVLDGVRHGEPVLVAETPDKIEVLHSHLSDVDAPRVMFVDSTAEAKNPNRVIPDLIFPFLAKHPHHHVRIICEWVWPERSRAAKLTAIQNEALTNLVDFLPATTMMCPYDISSLDPADIVSALRCHPTAVTGGGAPWTSHAFADPLTVASRCLEPFPEPVADYLTEIVIYHGTNVPLLLAFVAGHAAHNRMTRRRQEQLEEAITEIADNALRHAKGPSTVRLWAQEGAIICEVRDRGHVDDPLIGRRPADPDAEHGHGLLRVNALCDLVQISPQPSGTTIRLHMQVNPPG
ncbi:anti-sigma factor RsbA family regulatory protein [Actinopolymorpha pittospori]